ncbi:MAG TPA: NAD(P)-binding domain-containing protein [Gemmatimonadota bacterium]|nr:NAD(P)-binding domain-containing protein [Gemmatimonadota bacterium]
MKIGIIGSGIVGQTLGASLARGGHEVVLGTRDPKKLDEKRGFGDSLAEWLGRAGKNARVATFEDAARHGEVVINATAGTASLKALEAAGKANLKGKILIDVANPLDFSKGMPPTMTVCNTDSLGEQVQRAFPEAKVVKTLNTVNSNMMVAPGAVADGDHVIFLCGDDAGARAQVARYLHDWFGWKEDSVVDLGGIEAARGTEMLLPLWVRLLGVLGTHMFNFRIVR